jgi:hypothetical protein
VVYSSQGHIVVQVVVMSVDIVSGERHKTNVLTYIFRWGEFLLLRVVGNRSDACRPVLRFQLVSLRRSTVGEFADTCPVPKRAAALPDAANGSHASGGQYGVHASNGHSGAASGTGAHRIPEVCSW